MPQSKRGESLSQSTDFIRDQKLWLKILIGMVLGVSVGLAISPDGFNLLNPKATSIASEWLALPGVIFLALIQMVIIPLIVCSIILGIAQSDNLTFLKQMGLRLIPYFILTTMIAITIGIGITTFVKPGLMIDQTLINNIKTTQTIPATTLENLSTPQRIANILPTNPAKANLERNMLQIVIASILLGIALITIPAGTGKPFKNLCVAGQVLSMRIISWAMVIAPYAVFGLLSSITLKIGLSALLTVGLYTMCVLAGLGIMFLIYLSIIALATDIKVLSFIKGIREAQLLAFSTSSSAATMPFSIQAAENNLNIRPEISRFIIPLGATINMDGTALYQGVAALFLCQVFGIDLSFSEMVLLLLTTVGASIGTPATPGVGLVVLITILIGIGVPAEGVALIIGVDRLLDMCRTTINVTGDLTATAVMNKWLPAPGKKKQA